MAWGDGVACCVGRLVIWKREIAERDNWTCGICGEPVDPAFRHPHRESPALDHIHPLSDHGENSPANVQLAHAGCNRWKARKVLGGGVRKSDEVIALEMQRYWEHVRSGGTWCDMSWEED
jgi:5-methylcytosine-specific restriction endonuclease McrA